MTYKLQFRSPEGKHIKDIWDTENLPPVGTTVSFGDSPFPKPGDVSLVYEVVHHHYPFNGRDTRKDDTVMIILIPFKGFGFVGINSDIRRAIDKTPTDHAGIPTGTRP